MATAPLPKKMPPPPPLAINDPMFNHWLHELMAFIKEGGGIDPGTIPGYGTVVTTVANHTTELAVHTSEIATNSSNIATNTSNIATNTANISTLFSTTATHSSQIASLAARSQVLNGAGGPSGGVDGDWYADTSGHHIHVKVSGSWVQIV